MREWRLTHPLTPAQRFKDNARSKAAYAVKMGRIKREPCETCGDPKSQMHHDDYDKPLEVRWLCTPCHREHHRIEGMLQVSYLGHTIPRGTSVVEQMKGD